MIDKDLKKFRKELHRNPELSDNEDKTASKIIETLSNYNPDKIMTNIGGKGCAAVFNFTKPGKTIVFRAELDALPITESNEFEYKSKTSGVSHSCGHDGHMTILIGLAKLLDQNRKALCGKVILLFQPAEEIAAGAKRIIQDNKFLNLKPDYIFALHNLPGFELNKIILKKGIFASTSIGLKIHLKGETSHAGHPENGRNPVMAFTSIVNDLIAIPQIYTSFQQAALVTIIHAILGEEAFGTSPGKATIMATFRAHSDEVLIKMKKQAEILVKKSAEASNLDFSMEWVEYFPALINDDNCVESIENTAKKLGFKLQWQTSPFSWTEDFSYYTQKIPGAFFGLGSGKDHPQLHNSNYDFPNEILSTGIKVFYNLIKEINRN
ncbi:MAG: amidohydrolase [Candidatus Cloacimonetes bacterium]|nr:amidohydrolase [Candidatus Cloacimonadota bacterium]MCF7813939.1 amidohydrolase [Candidatus Cloacimonadota bacterium]MCF7868033.1 amidohydrolase [Candidatus Cloacimonadota bacterium]MCF7883953.1 amidohydrolase [Candidatus Cloacimonadota bacterium]